MEDRRKDQSSSPVDTVRSSSKLRYPLRSAAKLKDEKSPVTELPNSSTHRRGRPSPNVSKSVGVLEFSGNDKSAKPPRRLSIPAKSSVANILKPIGIVTPISEARAKRSVNSHVKSDTPVSDVSRSSNRKKFSVLSSASYWISQIKLSESVAKHSISFGFFKLALEAQCEPLQRMRDELKSYASRHNIAELGESVKNLFDSYNILDHLEQLQVSEICSQVPEEGTRSSEDDVHSSTSITGTRKLEPKSLNTDTVQASPAKESAKNETDQKNNPGTQVKRSLNKDSVKPKSVSETAEHNVPKNSQKPNKKEANKGKEKIKRQEKKSSSEEGPVNPPPEEEKVQENKENMDGLDTEDIISSTEV